MGAVSTPHLLTPYAMQLTLVLCVAFSLQICDEPPPPGSGRRDSLFIQEVMPIQQQQ